MRSAAAPGSGNLAVTAEAGDLDDVGTVEVGGTATFRTMAADATITLINLDDPLSQQASVSFAELSDRPMVLLDLPRTREYFTGLFERRGYRPKIAHTTRSAEIARALVAGGFGYTILNIRPPDYVENRLSYRAVPISGLEHGQSFGIATLANTRPPKIVQAFIDSCVSLQKRGVFDSLTVWADEPPKHQKIGQ